MEEYGPKGHIKIAHISDIHVGSNHFVSNLLNRAIMEINEMEPDVVLVSGDLTNEGFRQEYSAVGAYLGNIRCEKMVVIPGNHDSRNVGYVHFEDLFGSRNSALYMPGVTIVALDSSQPDLNEGRLGRQNYRWIAERFTNPNDFKIVVLHHHLIPLPGTGRERNIIEDAGDFLELLVSEGLTLCSPVTSTFLIPGASRTSMSRTPGPCPASGCAATLGRATVSSRSTRSLAQSSGSTRLGIQSA